MEQQQKIEPAELATPVTPPAVSTKLPLKNEGDVRELLEKNLKWSQIIYEQNRRIYRHLWLGVIFTWVKWAIILAVLVLGTYFAWPLVKNLQAQYSLLMNQFSPGRPLDKTTVESILKLLPLDQVNQDQVKALVK
ncbi:MAG: hypothetical protein PHD72_02345 [Patescibacteria group bacterium]|nr:hypothetical protein [Patescibacteria group bacterium]